MQASLNTSSSASPRYHQVRLALRQRIRDGIYTGVFPCPASARWPRSSASAA